MISLYTHRMGLNGENVVRTHPFYPREWGENAKEWFACSTYAWFRSFRRVSKMSIPAYVLHSLHSPLILLSFSIPKHPRTYYIPLILTSFWRFVGKFGVIERSFVGVISG
jgi:hypothetical protein